MLIPSIIMYVVEAYGWKVTLGPSAKNVPFWRVLAIQTAGEVVNMTTPTAYVGGEPLKAYLLTKHHVPMVEGFASVVIAKTTNDDCRSALHPPGHRARVLDCSAKTAHPGRTVASGSG